MTGMSATRPARRAWWSTSMRSVAKRTGTSKRGFLFDVPVRFATDRIEVDHQALRAGLVADIPVIEAEAQAVGAGDDPALAQGGDPAREACGEGGREDLHIEVDHQALRAGLVADIPVIEIRR
jgi:hypothetical protein